MINKDTISKVITNLKMLLEKGKVKFQTEKGMLGTVYVIECNDDVYKVGPFTMSVNGVIMANCCDSKDVYDFYDYMTELYVNDNALKNLDAMVSENLFNVASD
jgi:hypothetical protein